MATSIQQYTSNLMKRYDRNRDGWINMTSMPAFGVYPEVTGRAADFFQRSSPIGQFVTHEALVAQAVAEQVDTNRDGRVSFFEGLTAWVKFGINGLF
ncbi:MAG: EF-hand domain-containing protein [Candidatus Sericytochromatia bacterium]|nr:EF-hand domain-containing protein [Candidatus Sericytochromatia bacterium]